MKKILISFSGGRTSAYMAYKLLKGYGAIWDEQKKCHVGNDGTELISVFANTGLEREETLHFVDRCDKYFDLHLVWVEGDYLEGRGTRATVVNYETASRSGEVFEQMIIKYGMPNTNFPQCSRETKRYPIQSYAKAIGWAGYYTAIGIRADEMSRINEAAAAKDRIIYPLADAGKRVSRFDVNMFWSKQPFDLELKSYEGNCTLCWKKSKRKLLTIIDENPQLIDPWIVLENQYSRHIPDRRKPYQKARPPFHFYRSNQSAGNLYQEAQKPFKKATDESKDINLLMMMEDWSEEMDTNGGCSESCEAF